MGIRSLCAW